MIETMNRRLQQFLTDFDKISIEQHRKKSLFYLKWSKTEEYY